MSTFYNWDIYFCTWYTRYNIGKNRYIAIFVKYFLKIDII